jgi:hypothetical protein
LDAIANKDSISARYLHETWKSSSAASRDQLEDNLVCIYHKLKPNFVNIKPKKAEDFSYWIGQTIRNAKKTKYKTVDKKKNPIPMGIVQKPVIHHPYKDIPPIVPLTLPTQPPNCQNFQYTKKITPEHIQKIIGNIPNDFLSEEELDLLLYAIAQREKGLVFDESE